MSAKVPIGIDDFRALREHGLTYVDKSHLICELVDRPGAQTVLLPRPRRFGKSLGLSMLRCFFEKRGEDFTHLFEDLAVWREQRYRAHFQRYPVIQLGFADVAHERLDDLRWAVQEKIRDLFDEHRAVLDSGALSPLERARYAQMLDGSAPPGLYQRALLDLSRALHHAHGEKVILLIDEHEQPVHAAQAHGYAGEALDFLRAFYTTGLQGNPHLARAVLTGTPRVSHGGVFAGPFQLAVYTVLRAEFATCFGFTESEVETLLERAGRQGDREPLARWYGGYRFGEHAIYNPWSVLSYLADAQARVRPYWPLASGTENVRHAITHDAAKLRPLFEALLAGESVESVLDENVPRDRLQHSREALWSLLVSCGYLSAAERPGMEQPAHELSIPNREVRTLYRTTFLEWLGTALERPRHAAASPRELGEDGPQGAEERQRAERLEREEDDLGLQRAGSRRHEREEHQPGDPRQRRPDIVADADAFEDRLQQFFEDMRAHPVTAGASAASVGTTSIGPGDAGPADAEPAEPRPDVNSEAGPDEASPDVSTEAGPDEASPDVSTAAGPGDPEPDA